LSEEEIFFWGLEPDLERARKLPVPLTLASIRLQNHQALKEELGGKRYDSLLDELEAAAQETARRCTDRVETRRQHGELVAVLLDTTRDGGLTWCLRLLQHIRDATAIFEAPVRWSCGCAVFPEEAATAQRLYRLAVERAVPLQKPEDSS
jgi:predicted signal transduction protein with EAL and GGDEF domain